MLELRPNCELCDKDLPPDADNAFICAYERTSCAECVEGRLHDACPNCGGGFAPRPMRPASEHRIWERREGTGLARHPASTVRIHTKYADEAIAGFAAKLKAAPPARRQR